MNAGRCPDKQTLFGYMMGTISEGEAETVDRHLASCPGCERTAEALEGLSDTMITALRQPAGTDVYAEVPECGQVLQKLRQLQSGNPEASSRPPAVAPTKKPRRVTQLGDYELLTKLGQGGMGTVYKARHTRLKRVVALKVLPKDRLQDEVALARFEREMEAVGRLDHPNIVRAMDAREIDKIRFLVMEYVDGLDLSQVVDRCGPLSIADACETIHQAALGLECSRENGLVHRDIKPSNLMLSAEGQVKVLDLGLAQIQEAESLGEEVIPVEVTGVEVTGVGQVMGTPDYISPEQALESHTVDIRTDVYSLGCTLYCLLVGHPPFTGPDYDTPMKKVTGHIRDTAPPIGVLKPDVPKPIARLLERMLVKDPNERVASPSEVIIALAPFCEGSKLIGLLRQARSQDEQDEPGKSRIETGELQASAMIDTSRDDLEPGKKQGDSSASAPLDPYHRWLGIPPEAQPANHYGLLGLAVFEDDPEVIRDAAARQMAHVRTYHLGPHAEMSQEILNELGAAKACLINRKKKAAYDAWLRTAQHSEPMDERKPAEPPPVSAEFLASVQKPAPRTGIERLRLNLPRFNGKKPPAFVWIAAGAAGLFVFLSVVIYVNTGKGRIKIDVTDPEADVEVRIDGDVVEISGPEGTIRLWPGEYNLLVTSDNFKTYTKTFTVKRGGNTLLKVTLVPVKSAPLAENAALPLGSEPEATTPPEPTPKPAPKPTELPEDITNSSDMKLDREMNNTGSAMEEIYKAIRITNVRIIGDAPYKPGDTITIAYDLKNTSKKTLTIPVNNSYSRPFKLIGARQHWVEHIGDATAAFPGGSKERAKRAAGGAIIPTKSTISAGETLSFEQRHDTHRYPSGKYRYYIEYKELYTDTNAVIQTETVEFEIIATDTGRAGPDSSDASPSVQPKSPGVSSTLSDAERAEGWKSLFDGKTLDGWQGATDDYTVKDGKLICFGNRREALLTNEHYSDFVLRFEFKLDPGANNGVLIRAPFSGNAAYDSMEIQILDDSYPNYANYANSRPWNCHGAIWGVRAAKRGYLKPVGQWNSQEILCDGRQVTVTLNGTKILNVNLDEIAASPADGKYHPGLSRTTGYLGFFGSRAGRVEFRNIRLKDLTEARRQSPGASSTPSEVSVKDVRIRTETEAQSASSLVQEIILPTGTAWNPDIFEIDPSKLNGLLDDFKSKRPSVFGSVDQHKWFKYAVYRYRENNKGNFVLDGLATAYYGNDRLVYYAEYRENDLNGLMMTWSPQGKPIYCGEYRNNKRNGFCCLFEDDSLRLISEYDDDNLLACVWIDGGELKSYKKEQVAEAETVQELLARMDDIQGDTVREYKKTLISQLVDDRRQRESKTRHKIGIDIRKRNHEEIVRRADARRAGILQEIRMKKRMAGYK